MEAGRVKVVFSIVLSAVLLGLVVANCIKEWMPSEPNEWILWGALVAVGVIAILRIASLAKLLGKKDEEKELI